MKLKREEQQSSPSKQEQVCSRNRVSQSFKNRRKGIRQFFDYKEILARKFDCKYLVEAGCLFNEEEGGPACFNFKVQ